MSQMEELIRSKLTPDQADAALDTRREVLCLACAGSGKSQTLAFRVARLISEGVPPASIVAFTFTEKAAESIKRRIAQTLTLAGLSTNLIGQMYIGTIHAFCQNVLGKADAKYRQYDVLDDNRLTLFLMSRYPILQIKPLKGRFGGRYFETIKEVAAAWKLCQDEGLDVTSVTALDPEVGAVLQLLKDLLDRDQYLDFGSMIRLVVEHSAANNPAVNRALSEISHLLVDEYQDVSPSQEALIRAIHAQGASLFVVGDDDQAIYSWRGADVSNILMFRDRYHIQAIHTLDTNFRSTRAIVDVSADFIAQELGAARLPKNPKNYRDVAPRELANFLFDNRDEEAEWVASRIEQLLGTRFTEKDGTERGLTAGDIAILMRSTRGSEQSGEARHNPFTSRLMAKGIPFTLEAGGNPFDRPQVAVLRDVFRLLADGNPDRTQAKDIFDQSILPAYPMADFARFAHVLSDWGRRIHAPAGGVRQRLLPQNLVFELLSALQVSAHPPAPEVMREIGLFSRMIQDVEGVYLSVDSADRFRQVSLFLEFVADSGYNLSTDDVTQRPDAISVATVHSAKGLEFPVVFVADCQAGRFPGRNSNYRGLIPDQLVRAAIQRGAYVGTREAEARLFYTALTRAEAFLYVTGAANLPGGKKTNKASPFALRMTDAELIRAIDAATNLPTATRHPRVDETILPTSFSDVRYYLHCPMDYRFRREWGFSPAVPELFGYGRAVHVAVEKLHELHPDRPPTRDEAAIVASDSFHLKHIAPSRDPHNRPGAYERAKDKAIEIAQQYVVEFSDDFTTRRQVEARFEIPAADCLITGSIDLLVNEGQDGTIRDAEVIDFKTMEAGNDPFGHPDLDWLALSLQVQLYAKAAREILQENAVAGSVHLLKDNRRIQVPIDSDAVRAAVANVEWAVQGILSRHFPMRPAPAKCQKCDFQHLCSKQHQEFDPALGTPPPIHTPDGQVYAKAFLSAVE
ncbi:ATP-dependent DNA helicase Rep [compost metagenome]